MYMIIQLSYLTKERTHLFLHRTLQCIQMTMNRLHATLGAKIFTNIISDFTQCLIN